MSYMIDAVRDSLDISAFHGVLKLPSLHRKDDPIAKEISCQKV